MTELISIHAESILVSMSIEEGSYTGELYVAKDGISLVVKVNACDGSYKFYNRSNPHSKFKYDPITERYFRSFQVDDVAFRTKPLESITKQLDAWLAKSNDDFKRDFYWKIKLRELESAQRTDPDNLEILLLLYAALNSIKRPDFFQRFFPDFNLNMFTPSGNLMDSAESATKILVLKKDYSIERELVDAPYEIVRRRRFFSSRTH